MKDSVYKGAAICWLDGLSEMCIDILVHKFMMLGKHSQLSAH